MQQIVATNNELSLDVYVRIRISKGKSRNLIDAANNEHYICLLNRDKCYTFSSPRAITIKIPLNERHVKVRTL